MNHRSTSAPATLPLWRQRWHDLLFAHWPVPASVLQPHIPAPLTVDTYQHQAWLGLVPFRMSHVTFRGVPPVPWLSAFAEMNLRTYVTLDDTPGVWFFRMDAARLPAVIAARLSLGLPYVWSSMRISGTGDRIDYHSRRGAARFDGSYAPTGPVTEATLGSLEAFLTDWFCLYTRRTTQLLRVDIDHPPWPLQPASLESRTNTVAESCGLPAPGPQLLLHFARRLDVVGWGAHRVRP